MTRFKRECRKRGFLNGYDRYGYDCYGRYVIVNACSAEIIVLYPHVMYPRHISFDRAFKPLFWYNDDSCESIGNVPIMVSE